MSSVNGLVVFILCVAGFMLSLGLIGKLLHRQWLPHYEEWKKAINKIGLYELDNSKNPDVTGTYRNHHVTIHHRIISGSESDSYETHYYVDFDNPKSILFHIKRRSFYMSGEPPAPEFFAKKVKEFKVGDAEFDSKFVVKSNDENLARSILDLPLRDAMNNARNTLSPSRNIEVGYVSAPFDPRNTLSIFDAFSYREEPDIVHYIDPRRLSRVEEDADRIRAILDIMVLIVERIETYNPS
ncbi:DUF3137 domain-containing protein [Candidatus Bathyarchaeota archaeon]|nr:DUF3137 domain-containing protein [Candidatus Bathyarchaeota archaeon]